MAPHVAAGTLKSFEIHGDLFCAQPTDDEKQKRVDLWAWIKTLIYSNGVEVTVEDFLESDEDCYEFEDIPIGTEGSLSVADESLESEYWQGSTEASVRDAEDTDQSSSENGLPEKENPEEQCQAVEY